MWRRVAVEDVWDDVGRVTGEDGRKSMCKWADALTHSLQWDEANIALTEIQKDSLM